MGMGNFRKNIHRNLTIRFLWIQIWGKNTWGANNS